MDSVLLAFPGHWRSRGELIQELTQLGLSVVAAEENEHIVKISDEQIIDLQPSYPNLAENYQSCSGSAFSRDELERLAAAPTVAYLFTKGQSLGAVARAIDFSHKMIKLTPLAVRSEISGVAHPVNRWLDLVSDFDVPSVFAALVMVISSPEEEFSCGMHTFGLPDVAVPITFLDRSDCQSLVKQLCYYQLARPHAISDGDIVTVGAGQLRGLITTSVYEGYDSSRNYFNSFGKLNYDLPSNFTTLWGCSGTNVSILRSLRAIDKDQRLAAVTKIGDLDITDPAVSRVLNLLINDPEMIVRIDFLTNIEKFPAITKLMINQLVGVIKELIPLSLPVMLISSAVHKALESYPEDAQLAEAYRTIMDNMFSPAIAK